MSTAVVVLTGPPGSGKSTLLERLEERLRKGLRENLREGSAADSPGVLGVEAGDLLRRESERDSELGRQVRPYLERGKLAPTALVEQVVARVLEDNSAPVALFDGFPRDAEQVESLERVVQSATEALEQAGLSPGRPG